MEKKTHKPLKYLSSSPVKIHGKMKLCAAVKYYTIQ